MAIFGTPEQVQSADRETAPMLTGGIPPHNKPPTTTAVGLPDPDGPMQNMQPGGYVVFRTKNAPQSPDASTQKTLLYKMQAWLNDTREKLHELLGL